MGHAPQAALNVGYRPIPVPALRLAGQLAWSADPLSRPRRDLRQRPWAPYYGNPWPMWPRRELRENAWAEFVLVSWPSTGNNGLFEVSNFEKPVYCDSPNRGRRVLRGETPAGMSPFDAGINCFSKAKIR